jgi:hypothetical protein
MTKGVIEWERGVNGLVSVGAGALSWLTPMRDPPSPRGDRGSSNVGGGSGNLSGLGD